MERKLTIAPRATRKPRTTKTAPTLQQIQQRAYQIYLERRGAPGNAMQDWLQAERELAPNGGSPKPTRSRSPKNQAA